MANQENSGMYKMEPLYNFGPHIPMPSCMYKMKSIYTAGELECTEVKQDSTFEEIEHRQLQVLKKLEDLKADLLEFKGESGIVKNTLPVVTENKQCTFHVKVPVTYQDIVIKASPEHPPLSIWVFRNLLLAEKVPTQLATFVHSSLIDVPKVVQTLHQDKDCHETFAMSFTILWKTMGKDAEMMVDPVNQGTIAGEVNIARYIARLLSLGYDTDAFAAAAVDYWLQMIHSALIHGSNKERNTVLKTLNSHFGKNRFLGGNEVSVADIFLWSAVIQCKLQQSLPNNIGTWWLSITSLAMFKTPLNDHFLPL